MEEILKIDNNGQWTLEKADKKRMVEILEGNSIIDEDKLP